MPSSPFLRLAGVTKRYGAAAALDDVDIDFARGDFVTLLGPSGSGKSTALMTIAGFVTPDTGRVEFEGRDITALPPEKRGFGVVFQGYALFPHMSVAHNVAYPLEVRGLSRAEIGERVRKVLDMVKLDRFADRRPGTLSGGQQQRVAIARALVYEPPLLLLDEPLSALDRKLRGELQGELKALHARLGTTFVNVTHDQEEALSLSTSVVLLSEGRVVQQAAPDAIYDRPETAFAAEFIGSANLLTLADARPDGDLWRGTVGGATLAFVPRHPAEPGGRATLAIRQEVMALGAAPPAEGNALSCTVSGHDRVGYQSRVAVEVTGVGTLRLVLHAPLASGLAVGSPAWLSWGIAEGVHVRTG